MKLIRALSLPIALLTPLAALASPTVRQTAPRSGLAGIAVGHVATQDGSPYRFAGGAIATALLTGLLGCGTTGIAGALGVAIGLVAGGVTGWVVSSRTATA